MDFSNVACEKRGFRCAPEIKRIRMRMISPDRPWSGTSRGLKEFFNALLVDRANHIGAGVMLDHIGIRVADYERSKKFYAAALAPLGYQLFMEGSSGAGFRKEMIPDFWVKQGTS